MPPKLPGLIIMIGLCLLPIFLRIIKKNRFYKPWAINGLLLLPIIVSIHSRLLPQAELINALLIISFLALPMLLQKQINSDAQKIQSPAIFIKLFILKALCPFYPTKEIKQIITLLKEGSTGTLHSQEVLDISTSSSLALGLKTQLIYQQADWLAAKKWLAEYSLAEIEQQPWLSLLHIRSLCHFGDLEGALTFTQKIRKSENQLSYYTFHLIYIFSFSGHLEATKFALNSQQDNIPESSHQLWTAIALFNSKGHMAEGRERLIELIKADDLRVARSAAEALNTKPHGEELNTDETFRDFKDNIKNYNFFSSKKKTLTFSLLAINLAMFLLSQRNHNLTAMLWLEVPRILETFEIWRFLSSTFLHHSTAHCLSNMLMLIIFGIFIENCYAGKRYLFIYLCSGVSGMLMVTWVYRNSPNMVIVLGASGSTMSLIGAYLAVLIHRLQTYPLRYLKRQIVYMLLLIATQFTIDYITPQTSLTAHSTGLVIGFISGYILYMGKNDNPEPDFESNS